MYKYDAQITVWDITDTTNKYILKQYFVKDLEFVNPVSSGSELLLMSPNKKSSIQFSDNLKVVETPNPNPRSIIWVEGRKHETEIRRIEDILSQYEYEEI